MAGCMLPSQDLNPYGTRGQVAPMMVNAGLSYMQRLPDISAQEAMAEEERQAEEPRADFKAWVEAVPTV